eukprot:UN22728
MFTVLLWEFSMSSSPKKWEVDDFTDFHYCIVDLFNAILLPLMHFCVLNSFMS